MAEPSLLAQLAGGITLSLALGLAWWFAMVFFRKQSKGGYRLVRGVITVSGYVTIVLLFVSKFGKDNSGGEWPEAIRGIAALTSVLAIGGIVLLVFLVGRNWRGGFDKEGF